ncbi:12673_t:CDS:2 [Acaulospora morrowiae]|uniref:12673_t:CDS:1 n=1 Tax=Acaulospora morrowiae TaxID=94023 RepID=A0A9N9HIH5_9GLOM|nr:12673_t:CDS:2 [Acaulospora morrowiae]
MFGLRRKACKQTLKPKDHQTSNTYREDQQIINETAHADGKLEPYQNQKYVKRSFEHRTCTSSGSYTTTKSRLPVDVHRDHARTIEIMIRIGISVRKAASNKSEIDGFLFRSFPSLASYLSLEKSTAHCVRCHVYHKIPAKEWNALK